MVHPRHWHECCSRGRELEITTLTKPNIHTVPHGPGQWANRREGSERVSASYKTQAEAAAAGRAVARQEKVEHLIHGRNGEIRERNSYGHDPFPPRG